MCAKGSRNLRENIKNKSREILLSNVTYVGFSKWQKHVNKSGVLSTYVTMDCSYLPKLRMFERFKL